jgi:hypothetical protein
MKKYFLFAMVALALAGLSLSGCANQAVSSEAVDEAVLQADLATTMKTLGTAAAPKAFASFDAKYGTELSADFAGELAKSLPQPRLSSGSSSYPEHVNMPFKVDGAIYLSGGGDSVVSKVIDWVSPKNLPGGYFHGGALDLDKYDPNNLGAECVETAISKGAGYQSAADWRAEVNACVLNPTFAVDQAKLDKAQSDLDYYCKDSNTDQEYGFFKNYVNIFNVVTKEDNYTWYCTKVAWRVWKAYGIDIDSNDARIDFTKSGLYSMVKAYYTALHPFSSSARNAAINSYISDAKKKIVFAEEIMCSPYFTKDYELIQKTN